MVGKDKYVESRPTKCVCVSLVKCDNNDIQPKLTFCYNTCCVLHGYNVKKQLLTFNFWHCFAYPIVSHYSLKLNTKQSVDIPERCDMKFCSQFFGFGWSPCTEKNGVTCRQHQEAIDIKVTGNIINIQPNIHSRERAV